MRLAHSMMATLALATMGMSSPYMEIVARPASDPWRDADFGMRPARSALRPRRISNRMPHIGTKERARHAGKPDGPMHGLPLLFRA